LNLFEINYAEAFSIKNEELKVKELYDSFAKLPVGFYYLDALCGRITENSIYRKRTIATLGIKKNDYVLDVACGIGFNFKILEDYLQNTGKLVGIDISTESLKVAKGIALKKGWNNITLINKSINDYQPSFKFDAILCTLAMEIIPDYIGTINKIYDLLKENGRFAMLGMKLSNIKFLKPFNPIFDILYKTGGIDTHRNIVDIIKAKFKKMIYYEQCFFDSYYILCVTKTNSTEKGKKE